MPTIKRFRRCRIEMYFGDHNPPHFHVITNGEARIAVAIKTLAVLAGNAPARDVAEAIEWARSHPGELLTRWATYSEVE